MSNNLFRQRHWLKHRQVDIQYNSRYRACEYKTTQHKYIYYWSLAGHLYSLQAVFIQVPIFEFEQSWDTLAGSLKLFLVGGKEGWGVGGEGGITCTMYVYIAFLKPTVAGLWFAVLIPCLEQPHNKAEFSSSFWALEFLYMYLCSV